MMHHAAVNMGWYGLALRGLKTLDAAMGPSQKFLSIQHHSQLMSSLSKDETGFLHILMLMVQFVFGRRYSGAVGGGAAAWCMLGCCSTAVGGVAHSRWFAAGVLV
jgi:hypothetical protein